MRINLLSLFFIVKFICQNELATKKIAKKLAQLIQNNKLIIYLSGNLGAGKTTFARGFIQHFGFDKVKSPTYSIVESYENKKITIHHFDLYRLNNFVELEIIGVREYFDNICLIEWAENIQDFLPKNDIKISLSGHKIRQITITANSTYGEKLLKNYL